MEGKIGFARSDQAVPSERLGFDPATEPSPGGVDRVVLHSKLVPS